MITKTYIIDDSILLLHGKSFACTFREGEKTARFYNRNLQSITLNIANQPKSCHPTIDDKDLVFFHEDILFEDRNPIFIRKGRNIFAVHHGEEFFCHLLTEYTYYFTNEDILVVRNVIIPTNIIIKFDYISVDIVYVENFLKNVELHPLVRQVFEIILTRLYTLSIKKKKRDQKFF